MVIPTFFVFLLFLFSQEQTHVLERHPARQRRVHARLRPHPDRERGSAALPATAERVRRGPDLDRVVVTACRVPSRGQQPVPAERDAVRWVSRHPERRADLPAGLRFEQEDVALGCCDEVGEFNWPWAGEGSS